MSGMVLERRPPKINALMGTPSGSSHAGSIDGHCEAGAVNRPLGCAAFAPVCVAISGVHFSPRQSSIERPAPAGGSSVIPSHHTPSGTPLRSVSATLVKIVLRLSAAMALGLVFALVPGATPKNPVSGLMARNWPFASGLIHAMSSPTVVTFQPLSAVGGTSIARLVLPQAEGNAAAM